MLGILALLVISVLACLGLGRLFPVVGSGATALAFSGLTGLVLLAAIAFLAGLFFSLASVSPWIIWPAAATGLLCLRHSDKATISAIVVLSAVASMWASREVWHGDTGLYHLQAALWMSESPLPAGLVSLHGRFGFNSAWWSLAAVLPEAGFGGLNLASLPTALLCVLYGLLVWAASRAVLRREALAADWLVLATAFLWFRQLVGVNNPSLSNDAPANLLVLASAVALLRWAEQGSKSALATAFLLGCGAASVKLTGFLWLGSSLAATSVMWLRVPPEHWSRRDVAAVVVGLLLLATGFVRGYWSSGYPLYPLRLFGIPGLPWATPSDLSAAKMAEMIREWPVRGNSDGWLTFLRAWIENQYGLTNVMFAIVMVTIIAVAGVWILRRGLPEVARHLAGRIWPLWLAAVASCAAGFWFAPAFRFVSGFFFVAVGIVLVLLLRCRWPQAASTPAGPLLAVLAVAAIAPNIGQAFARPIGWCHAPQLPPPVVEVRLTGQGETVYVGCDGLPWAAPRPASPDFNPALRIRRDARGMIREFLSH